MFITCVNTRYTPHRWEDTGISEGRFYYFLLRVGYFNIMSSINSHFKLKKKSLKVAALCVGQSMFIAADSAHYCFRFQIGQYTIVGYFEGIDSNNYVHPQHKLKRPASRLALALSGTGFLFQDRDSQNWRVWVEQVEVCKNTSYFYLFILFYFSFRLYDCPPAFHTA